MPFDLPSGWAWRTLDSLSERVSVGHVGQTSEYFAEFGVPLVRSQNVRPGRLDLTDVRYITPQFHAQAKKSQIKPGDILVVRVGQNRGDCAVVPDGLGELNCANVVFARPDQKYSRFIGYFLNSVYGRRALLDLSSGSAQLVLNTKAVAQVLVPVPPKGVAHAISEILASLDDRIDFLRQTNTTLEAIAQALFKSWFVDFDPVHAKAEGREPEAMDAAIAALFPSEFEESELGPIPKGWRVDEIGNAVKCLGGGTPSTKEDAYWIDGEHHWVTPKDLAGLQAPVLTATSRRITDAGLSRISSGLLPRGTLLMSSRAPIGYLALAGIPTAINQGFIAMPPGGALSPEWLLFWAKVNMEAIKQKANGSTFMEISKAAFRPIRIVRPPPDALRQFDEVAGLMLDRIKDNECQITILVTLRDTLLPRLISGRLRVSEAERRAEECRP